MVSTSNNSVGADLTWRLEPLHVSLFRTTNDPTRDLERLSRPPLASPRHREDVEHTARGLEFGDSPWPAGSFRRCIAQPRVVGHRLGSTLPVASTSRRTRPRDRRGWGAR